MKVILFGATGMVGAIALVGAIAPGAVISTEELGRAMLRAARQGAPKRVLEPSDILALGGP
jgi:hypothetical protein